MKQFAIQLVVLLIIIFGSLLYVGTNLIPHSNTQTSQPAGQSNSGDYAHVNLKLDETVIDTEIADTQEKRSLGLGGRDSLASNSGMLFTFDTPSQYQFWMKDMRFALDFIWIKGDTVVDVLKNIPAPSPNEPDSNLLRYAPVTAVDKVLEVNAGFASSHNIKIGDKIYQVQ